MPISIPGSAFDCGHCIAEERRQALRDQMPAFFGTRRAGLHRPAGCDAASRDSLRAAQRQRDGALCVVKRGKHARARSFTQVITHRIRFRA
jgi:hypothetical protein